MLPLLPEGPFPGDKQKSIHLSRSGSRATHSRKPSQMAPALSVRCSTVLYTPHSILIGVTHCASVCHPWAAFGVSRPGGLFS